MTKATNDMKTTELTLEDILNSDLMNEIAKEEDQTLKESGWSRNDVNEMAKFVVKNSK